jgi:drug/metabolite transporter (DMT)-like permease
LLANTALWALYTACMRYMPRGIDPLALMLALFLAGMVTGLPVYAFDLATGGGIQPTGGVILGILYLSAVTSILCYLFWNRGVAAIGPAKAGAYLHLVPLLGALMAVVFLGERIEAYHIVGLALILAGVTIASRKG